MPVKQITFPLYAKGGTIGVVVDERLVVQSVQIGGPSDGKIKIGDKIARVNNEEISTKNQFTEAIRKRGGMGVNVVVWHDKDLCPNIPLNPSRPGFEWKEIVLVWNRDGGRLGLALKEDKEKNVYVSGLAKHSTADFYLKVGDRILNVDGWTVTSATTCGELMSTGFGANNRVTLKIERAVEEEAKSAISVVNTVPIDQEPSVMLNSDVKSVLNRQLEKLKLNEEKRPQPILHETKANSKEKTGSKEKERHVALNVKVQIQTIGQDGTSSGLQHVPKVPPPPPSNPK